MKIKIFFALILIALVVFLSACSQKTGTNPAVQEQQKNAGSSSVSSAIQPKTVTIEIRSSINIWS